MTDLVQIWIASVHHAASRCGGWAHVSLVRGGLSGTAGGERNTTPRRMALAGLACALRALPPAKDLAAGAVVRIHATSPDLAALAGFLTRLAEPDAPPPPGEAGADLDLWAQILTAASGRRLAVARVLAQPNTPAAFAAAWADLGMDKAKTGGAFTAAIPKPNLAKIQGLG